MKLRSPPVVGEAISSERTSENYFNVEDNSMFYMEQANLD
jgi:hypothetical protein